MFSFDEIKVDEVLNIVVFGESLLNDGVAVVLYHMFESFCKIGLDKVSAEDVGKGIGSFGVVAGGGVLIGILTGYICAFMTRNQIIIKFEIVLMFKSLDFSITPESLSHW